MAEVKFNTYKNFKETKIEGYLTLDDTIWLIKQGDKNKELIMLMRTTFTKEDENYKNLKRMLRAIIWNVTYTKGRKDNDIKGTTGYMYFDKDSLNEEEVKDYKDKLIALPYVKAVWCSVGGKGLGCILKVENVTKENYSDTWDKINKEIGIGFDIGAKKIGQVNIISYDPDIRINNNVQSYSYVANVSSTANVGMTVCPTSISNWEKVHSGSNNNKTQYICTHNAPNNTGINNTIVYSKIFDDLNFDNNDYKVYPNGVDYLKVYIPEVIPTGYRFIKLTSICKRLLELNSDKSKEELFLLIYNINKRHCKPALEYYEVKKMFESWYKIYMNGLLKNSYSKKVIVFNKNRNLTPKDKLSISGKEMGKIRRNRTLNKLIDTYVSLLCNEAKITQKQVAEKSNLSIRTIKKYWKEIISTVTMNKSVDIAA